MNRAEQIQRLQELDRKHFLHPTSSIHQQQQQGPSFIFTEGRGIYLYDITGRKLIDGMSSLWNVNVGHGRHELGEVAMKQMSKLAYSSCFATFSNEPAILLAERLASQAPGDLSTVFFTSGGSEANDTAYKLVRHYWLLKGEPKRKTIISRTKSYHGVAMGATSATGLSAFRAFTNSPAPDFLHVAHQSAQALRDLIEAEGAETIAAFIAEPVQGAGGVHVAKAGYFQEVRRICDEYGIIFITDEVITGFGRTGTYFGITHDGVAPDMMCFAKGVTSGYAQLGGVMLSKRMHEDLMELSTGTLLHGYTYSGHPTACAVALKNLEIIEREQLVQRAGVMGQKLLAGLQRIESEFDVISKAKGLGLMGGLEFDAGELSPIVVAEAAKRGLICRSVVLDDQDIVVCAPPLIMTEEEMGLMLEMLHDAVRAAVKS